MAAPVSFSKAILPLFRQVDINHMKPYDVFLDDYSWMSNAAAGKIGECKQYDDHANGRSVYAFLTGACRPRMPLGGPYWHDDMIALYQRWMDDGFLP